MIKRTRQGISYIETAGLDGETNLKLRSAHPLTMNESIDSIQGELHYELPNRNLYDFTGNLVLDGKDKSPVNPSGVLLRGSKLMQTDWIIGKYLVFGETSCEMKYTSNIVSKVASI